MSDQLVGEVRKNARGDVIRIERSHYRGRDLIHLRVWVVGAEGDLVPTKQGIALRPELVPAVLSALQRATR